MPYEVNPEYEVKLDQNVRFSELATCSSLNENLQIKRIFLITVDEMKTSIFQKQYQFKTR